MDVCRKHILLSQYEALNSAFPFDAMANRHDATATMERSFDSQLLSPPNFPLRFSLLEFAMVTLILGVAMVITIPVVLKSQTEAREIGCAVRMGNLAKSRSRV